MTLQLRALDEELVARIEPWFDDPETQRWLGGRDWIRREFEFRRANGLPAWVAFDGPEPIGYVDGQVSGVEGAPKDPPIEGHDHCFSAIVVAPHRRGQGYGVAILGLLSQQPELAAAGQFWAGIEAGNTKSLRTYLAAGYERTDVSDKDGMIYVRYVPERVRR